MNRNAKRAAQAQARTTPIDRVTAVHEAGHAVGRLLTAKAMGFPFDEAVHSIEIGTGPGWQSPDGQVVLTSQAICYGPALSRDLQDAYRRAYPAREPINADDLYSRLAGVGTAEQREVSARAKMLIIAMGPAAEARMLRARWKNVVLSDACAADRIDLGREGRLRGLEGDELIRAINAVGSRAMELVANPSVWRAIDAIAVNLKRDLSGKRVASLAARFLARWPGGHAYKLAA